MVIGGVAKLRCLFLIVEVREEPLPPQVGEVDTAAVCRQLSLRLDLVKDGGFAPPELQ